MWFCPGRICQVALAAKQLQKVSVVTCSPRFDIDTDYAATCGVCGLLWIRSNASFFVCPIQPCMCTVDSCLLFTFKTWTESSLICHAIVHGFRRSGLSKANLIYLQVKNPKRCIKNVLECLLLQHTIRHSYPDRLSISSVVTSFRLRRHSSVQPGNCFF